MELVVEWPPKLLAHCIISTKTVLVVNEVSVYEPDHYLPQVTVFPHFLGSSLAFQQCVSEEEQD